MAFVGFRSSLKKQIPRWLSDRPGFRTGFAILYSMAVMLDFMLNQSIEGLYAAWPGYGTPTALPLIGQARGFVQGASESDAAFALRNVGWLKTWTDAGADYVLVTEIQAYLGNTPTVRVVDRAGNWCSIDPAGNVTRFAAGAAAWVWDWDSVSHPERNNPSAPWWSDVWIIVVPSEWAVTAGTTGGGGLAAIWGASADVGIGHAVSRVANDAIRSLAKQWKGDHSWIQAIIWSSDATLFNPSVVNAGNPNGTWGEWAYDAHDGNGLQPRRSASARYWTPLNT